MRKYKILLAKQKSKEICHYCGTGLTDEIRTKDHVIPKSKGGVDGMTNIVWACKSCNMNRGNKPYLSYLQELGLLK